MNAHEAIQPAKPACYPPNLLSHHRGVPAESGEADLGFGIAREDAGADTVMKKDAVGAVKQGFFFDAGRHFLGQLRIETQDVDKIAAGNDGVQVNVAAANPLAGSGAPRHQRPRRVEETDFGLLYFPAKGNQFLPVIIRDVGGEFPGLAEIVMNGHGILDDGGAAPAAIG